MAEITLQIDDAYLDELALGFCASNPIPIKVTYDDIGENIISSTNRYTPIQWLKFNVVNYIKDEYLNGKSILTRNDVEIDKDTIDSIVNSNIEKENSNDNKSR